MFTRSRKSKHRAPDTVSNVRASSSHARRSRPQRGGHTRSALVEASRAYSRKKWFLILGTLILAIVVIGSAITAFTYFRSTDSNLELKESNAKEALVAQKAGEPYYVLMTANLMRPELGTAQSDGWGFMLVRIDEQSKTVTTATIPARLNVRTSEGTTAPLDEIRLNGGDAELIRAVSGLAEVSISHFVTTDASGIKGMTDALGGITMSLDAEIDDPNAGSLVIFSGEQKLTGAQALVFLRASNVANGVNGLYANRMQFTYNLARQAAGTEGFSFANAVGEASRFMYTDWTASDLLALGSALKPFSSLTFYECVVPAVKSNAKGTETVLFERSTKKWTKMLERFKAGQNPNEIEDSPEQVDPSSVTVEVRNGTSTAGAAARLGDKLTQKGYVIKGVGNTGDGIIYPETLIIYTKENGEAAAQSVVNAMGSGRVIYGGDYYSSEANVIAIIGSDYMPVN